MEDTSPQCLGRVRKVVSRFLWKREMAHSSGNLHAGYSMRIVSLQPHTFNHRLRRCGSNDLRQFETGLRE
jgi:hypothetical protein